MFKKSDQGYTLTIRLKMTLAQIENIDVIKVNDSLTYTIQDGKVLFYKDTFLVGEALPKDAKLIITHEEAIESTKVQSIHPQFGVQVTIIASTLELPVLTLNELDEKAIRKEKRSERRYKWHDANRFTPFRFFFYLLSSVLSGIVLGYALVIWDIPMIIMLGIVFISSLYLFIDQIKLYRQT